MSAPLLSSHVLQQHIKVEGVVQYKIKSSHLFFHDKHGILAKAIYAHLCRKSYLRSLGAFLSQKRFTRSVQKVFAHDILPTVKSGPSTSSPRTANNKATFQHILTSWHFTEPNPSVTDFGSR